MGQPGPSPVHEVVEVEGVVSVVLRGSFCGSEAMTSLLDAVHRIQGTGTSRIVIDLEGVERIDSAGLGAIASAYVSMTRVAGRIALAAAPSKIRDLLSATMLLQVIPLYPDVPSARAALRP